MHSEPSSSGPPLHDSPLRELKLHVVQEYETDVLNTDFRTLSSAGHSHVLTIDAQSLRRLRIIEDNELVTDNHQVRTALFDNGLLVGNLQPPWQP